MEDAENQEERLVMCRPAQRGFQLMSRGQGVQRFNSVTGGGGCLVLTEDFQCGDRVSQRWRRASI